MDNIQVKFGLTISFLNTTVGLQEKNSNLCHSLIYHLLWYSFYLLVWFSSKIVSNDLGLHSRWPTILQIGIFDNLVIQKHWIKWNVIWIRKILGWSPSKCGSIDPVHFPYYRYIVMWSSKWCICICVEQLQSFRSLFNWVTFEDFVTCGWWLTCVDT
jgi:hypothetical protein